MNLTMSKRSVAFWTSSTSPTMVTTAPTNGGDRRARDPPGGYGEVAGPTMNIRTPTLVKGWC
jgi:hypothetical protein